MSDKVTADEFSYLYYYHRVYNNVRRCPAYFRTVEKLSNSHPEVVKAMDDLYEAQLRLDSLMAHTYEELISDDPGM